MVKFSIVLVCLFFCLFACEQHYSKIYEWLAMKFYGGFQGGKRTLHFGGYPDLLR